MSNRGGRAAGERATASMRDAAIFRRTIPKALEPPIQQGQFGENRIRASLPHGWTLRNYVKEP